MNLLPWIGPGIIQGVRSDKLGDVYDDDNAASDEASSLAKGDDTLLFSSYFVKEKRSGSSPLAREDGDDGDGLKISLEPSAQVS